MSGLLRVHVKTNPQSTPCPNTCNSFKLKPLNRFQQLRATPPRVPDPRFVSAGQVHHGPRDLGKCLFAEAEPDHIHNRGRVSDLRGWIYYLLSTITYSTGGVQTKPHTAAILCWR